MNEHNTRHITFKRIKNDTGYSRVHIGRLEKAGKFPRRIKLGEGRNGRVVWLAHEYEVWLEERINRRAA